MKGPQNQYKGKATKKGLHFGLYGEKEILSPDFMHCDTIEFRTKPHIQSIKEHIHTSLFQIYIVEKGKLHLYLENSKHIINGPAIVTIPENTLHGVPIDKNLKGKVLTLSTSFIETLFKNTPQALQELTSTQIITEFDKQHLFVTISRYADNLHHEIKADLPEKKLVLQSYFNLLLGLIYRMVKRKSEKIIFPDSRNARYFSTFQKNIKQAYDPMKPIKQYAEQLNITSVHLNRICKSITGKPASQIINDFIILEAEKFLKQTDDNISEIAYRLNFEDPAYFSRFFHKVVGVSPKQFREENG